MATSVRYTADLCLFADSAGTRHVLLIQRNWDPYEGRWALPGGHVEPGETSRAAAAREGEEETGVAVSAELLTPVGVFDAPDRDPRGRYVTVAYSILLPSMSPPVAADDARAARWTPVMDLLRAPDFLAFDHHQILLEALGKHRR
jgi:8-oxo-dGTP diphosphatase